MCKISVIIPVYNAENTVQRSIDSVLSQDFTDLELLLIDDGSTDKSHAVCQAAADRDGRVRCFSRENHGAAACRNFAMREADGAFLCFVDSDDYIDDGCLSFLYAKAEETQADIVLCGYLMENGGAVSRIAAAPCLLDDRNRNEHIVELKSKNLIDSPCNKLYNAAFLRESGEWMPENHAFEDTMFNLSLLRHHPVIAVSDACFYHYVLHMGSVTRHYNPEKAELLKQCARLFKSITDGVDEYCDYYYVKSVFSALIDLFLSCKKKQIRAEIRKEITDGEFRAAAANAQAIGRSAGLIVKIARSGNTGLCYAFCHCSYLLKYKMQKLFLKVRE